jgi:hypothetical protein
MSKSESRHAAYPICRPTTVVRDRDNKNTERLLDVNEVIRKAVHATEPRPMDMGDHNFGVAAIRAIVESSSDMNSRARWTLTRL